MDYKFMYGDSGMISPDKFDRCLVESFNKTKGAETFKIEVIKKDMEWEENIGGTSYKIVKKLIL